MCCKTMSLRTNGKGKRSTLRMAAFLLCVLFVAASLLSAAYILTHANHIHDHDGPSGGCATCMHLQLSENLLRQLSAAIVAAAAAVGGLYGILFSHKTPILHNGFSTPVTLKVRLNN